MKMKRYDPVRFAMDDVVDVSYIEAVGPIFPCFERLRDKWRAEYFLLCPDIRNGFNLRLIKTAARLLARDSARRAAAIPYRNLLTRSRL